MPLWFICLLLRKYRYGESKLSYKIRYICYKILCKSIGENVKISPGVFITYPENIIIGNNVSINEFSIISGFGGIKIGNDVSIAHGCSILSSSHPYNNNQIKIREGELLKKEVIIGNNVWVGAGVTILYGKNIGNGVVIGAGSVVTKDIPDNSVCVGIPAKVKKERFDCEGF